MSNQARGYGQRSVTRRSVLSVTGGTVLGLAGWAGTAVAQSTPGFDGWFEETKNYQGIVDETGSSSVVISVGPTDSPGGPLVFGPAAVRVDPGTTITWEWTGEGGNHNVVSSDGSFESELTDEAGFTYEYTFEESGVYRYYCTPHKAVGMRGIVIVGDVELGSGGIGISLPGTEFEQTFIAIVLGLLSLSTVGVLLPDVPRAVHWGSQIVGRVGYGIHSRTGFRRRPLGASLVGLLTFATVLLLIGVVVVGLWFVGAGPVGFLAGLAVLALILARYLGSTAGVAIVPSFGRRRVDPTAGNPGGSLVSTVRGSSSNVGRFDLMRAVPVIRGWVVIASVFIVGAVGAVGLWQLSNGPLGLFIGLMVIVGLSVLYTVSTTQ